MQDPVVANKRRERWIEIGNEPLVYSAAQTCLNFTGVVWDVSYPSGMRHRACRSLKISGCSAAQPSGLNDECEIILDDGVTLGDM